MRANPRGHPVFARVYGRTVSVLDRGLGERRRALVAELSGRVVEVGAGTGSNFACYPAAVASVLAVEPEPHLRGLAREAAAAAAVPIEVVPGRAERLPAADASFDGAVACLVLCSVPDQRVALAEIFRVLRPGGRLRFLEHVRADTAGRRRVQRIVDATVWPLVGGGCHTGRDTAAAIRGAGFRIDELEHLETADTGIPFPAVPQIFGTATRP